MANLILDGALADQPCSHIDDETALPATGLVSVSLTRWQSERDALIARGDVALRLNGADTLTDAVADLQHFALIALEFPVFADGRCYSFARLLRDRHGYTGQLRAIGDVLYDQLFFMQRVGINAFEVRADRDVKDALRALGEFSTSYQAANDDPQPLYRRVQR